MQDDTRSNGDTLSPTPPELSQVLQCVFDIQTHEFRTLKTVSKLPGSTVIELADELERDRSNVNRSLTTLHENGLIDRERRLLEEGGYVYQYYPSPIDETKRLLHSGVDRWVDDAHAEIDSFTA